MEAEVLICYKCEKVMSSVDAATNRESQNYIVVNGMDLCIECATRLKVFIEED